MQRGGGGGGGGCCVMQLCFLSSELEFPHVKGVMNGSYTQVGADEV